MGNEQSNQQQGVPSSTTNTLSSANAVSSSSSYNPSTDSERRARKKQTGIKLATNEIQSMPSAKISNNVEVDDDMDEAQFLSTVQDAYGPSARVEINTSSTLAAPSAGAQFRNSSSSSSRARKQISYQVTFSSNDEARTAFTSNSKVEEKIICDLGLKGSDVAFDKPCKPRAIDGVTLQLDSDSSSILCGACLVYDWQDSCIGTVHYSAREFSGGVILHSGDTKVHGKSVHTIKLGLSDLDANKVKQLFFTLCACGPADLSQFKEPVISLHENDNPDINLIQYSIQQAGHARSVVMCRIFRNESNDANGSDSSENSNNWSIQALGTDEWHIPQKVCMHYQYANKLIDAHLKQSAKKTGTKGQQGANGSNGK